MKLQKAKELREQSAAKLQRMEALSSTAETENRDFNPDEQKEYDALKKEVESLQARAARLTAEATAEAASDSARIPFEGGGSDASGEARDRQKAMDSYSFHRAIRSVTSSKPLDGVELEMRQEAEKEAKASSINLEGHFAVPSWFVDIQRNSPHSPERRDMTVGTTTTGGHLVATNVSPMIPVLQPRLQTIGLGATVMSGLVGNVDMPRDTTNPVATWKAENATADELTPTLDKISLTPNRLTAFTDLSRSLVIQSAPSVEQFARRKLDRAIAIALDLAAINGSGSSNQPLGILNQSGIGSVAGGTNGAAPTLSHLIDLETAVGVANADMGMLAYLTTPGVRGKLKKTLIDAGSGLRVWDKNELNGYGAHVSTQVPSTLTKGSASGVCHAILFGNWEELIIAQWAGVDFIVNPYTKGKEALIELIVHSYYDIDVMHAASFAAMVDALVS